MVLRAIASAADLVGAGAGVAAIIDGGAVVRRGAPAGIRVIRGGAVVDTASTYLRPDCRALLGDQEEDACDALAMSGGFSPIVHLACQRGAKPYWSEEHQAFLAPRCRRGLAHCRLRCRSCLLSAVLRDGGWSARMMPSVISAASSARSTPGGRGRIRCQLCAALVCAGGEVQGLCRLPERCA